MMAVLRGVNLALAFFLELAALAAFAYWGYQTGENMPGETTLVKIGLAGGAALLAAVLWGIFAAPNSTRRLHRAALLIFKIAFFALAVGALLAVGQSELAVALGFVFAFNTVLLYIWYQ